MSDSTTLIDLKVMMETVRQPLLVLDGALRVVAANQEFHTLFQVQQNETIDRCIYEIGGGQWDSDGLKGFLGKIMTNNGMIRDFKVAHDFPGMGYKIMLLNGRQVSRGENVPRLTVIAIEDITERMVTREEAKFVSLHDTTTGLYSWTYFEEELERLDNARELPISIIMGDVNNLKLVNDVYGHQEGDKLLRVIADSIKASCRDSDIIARWGGGEFIILLPKTGLPTAEAIADRLKIKCGEMNTTSVRCSIAIGVAAKTQARQPIDEIIRRAEERMYKNKVLEANENRRIIVSSMLEKIGAMNEETQEHNQRSRDLTVEVGKAIGLSRKQLEALKLAASVHDIGKAGMSTELLEKPAKLTAREWGEIKKHTEIGYRIAHAFPELSHVADAILYHHERWDGKGYPKGLRGEEIPVLVRILTMIDAYDVMTHGRVYEKVLSKEEAIKELQRNAGTQFDPDLVKVFIQMLQKQASLARI